MIKKLNCSRRCLFKLFSELADSSSLLVLVDHFAWWASIAQVIAMEQWNMEQWNKMKEELKRINDKGFRGKSTIESAKVLSDIDSNNKRDDMFTLIRDLYNIAKKSLDHAKPSETTNGHGIPNNLEDIIKNQLSEVLPDLLKTALSALPAMQGQAHAAEDKIPRTQDKVHTLTVEVKSEEKEGVAVPMTESEWTTVVRKDLRGTLKAVPVQKASLSQSRGTATLKFSSKVHLDEAERVLQPKYKVSSKSEDRKKLDPKLTIPDIHPDVTTSEQLIEELLEKNENIRALSVGEKMIKVVFYDKKQRYAVIQVAPEIRESIRQNNDRVHTDLTSHHVRDRIHVIQCFHCQEFGHMANSMFCKGKDKDPVCFYCAGNHSSKDCNNKKSRKTAKIKCNNCSNSRSYSEKNAATTHKASDTLCPFYIRERERVMSRTIGCEPAKNLYLQRVKDLKSRLGRA